MNKKVNPLDKKVPTAFSISQRTLFLFGQKCKELGVSRSSMAEELILTFIKNVQ